jgi:hypothetical protein
MNFQEGRDKLAQPLVEPISPQGDALRCTLRHNLGTSLRDELGDKIEKRICVIDSEIEVLSAIVTAAKWCCVNQNRTEFAGIRATPFHIFPGGWPFSHEVRQ